MAIPSKGWLPAPFPDIPEHWILPVTHVCHYYDPGPVAESAAIGCQDIELDHISVIYGDSDAVAKFGWEADAITQTIEVRVMQTGVFGVVLLDTLYEQAPAIQCPPEPETVLVTSPESESSFTFSVEDEGVPAYTPDAENAMVLVADDETVPAYVDEVLAKMNCKCD